MLKRTKVIACLMATMMIGGAFAGCGSKDAGNAASTGGKEIKIWSQYTGENLQCVKDLAEAWAKQTGNKVKVTEDKNGFDSLVQASKGKNSPDCVVGVANDHLGSFQKADLIDEVPTGTMDDSDYIEPALKASAIGGKRYAVPLTLETYVLFYNKDKVKEAPKTWDDLISQAKTLGFNYVLNDFYYSLALIQANGGYVFKTADDGSADVKDIGLNNEGAVKGFTMINDLANTSKLISPSVTPEIARGNFQNGKVAFYLSGPWDVAAFKKANVNFGVATFPEIVPGTPVPTTAGIKFAVVPKASQNKDLAWNFMKYLAKNGPYKLFKQTAAIPVLKSEQAKDEIKNDPITSVFAKQSESARSMLSAPEFGTIWEPAKQNIQSMITNKETPKQAADNIVKQMQQKMATLK